MLEGAGAYSLEIAFPREQLSRLLAPELLRLLDRLLVQLLVMFQTIEMRFCVRVLAVRSLSAVCTTQEDLVDGEASLRAWRRGDPALPRFGESLGKPQLSWVQAKTQLKSNHSLVKGLGNVESVNLVGLCHHWVRGLYRAFRHVNFADVCVASAKQWIPAVVCAQQAGCRRGELQG